MTERPSDRAIAQALLDLRDDYNDFDSVWQFIETVLCRARGLDNGTVEYRDAAAPEGAQCDATVEDAGYPSNPHQCSRRAAPGSVYCAQHRKMYEPARKPEGAQGAVAIGRVCYAPDRNGCSRWHFWPEHSAHDHVDALPWDDLAEASKVFTVYTTPPQPQDAAQELPDSDWRLKGYAYASKQATTCAGCGEHKHTPLRVGAMGGYVCLTCIDKRLGSLLGEFGHQDAARDREDADLQQLSVLADIRKAIGDDGKLMQGELVAVIAKLAEDAERYRTLVSAKNLEYPEAINSRMAALVEAGGSWTSKETWDAAIDAARGAGGGGE